MPFRAIFRFLLMRFFTGVTDASLLLSNNRIEYNTQYRA